MWSGIKGIITQPVSEVKKKGAIGVLTVSIIHHIHWKGSLKGAAGLVIKPTVGVLDLISQSTNGIKNSTQSIFKLNAKMNQHVILLSSLDSRC